MKDKDYNEIAKYEKAIKDKYGNEAIQNPKKNWDEEKEAKYLEELKSFYKTSVRKKKREVSEGFEVIHKKAAKEAISDVAIGVAMAFPISFALLSLTKYLEFSVAMTSRS